MIILYQKDAPEIADCTFGQAIPNHMEIIDLEGKLYLENQADPIVNNANLIGWFAVPEQAIASALIDNTFDPPMEIPRTVGSLNLHYNWPEGFIPLPGTGVPEKIEHIEDFLTKMFPTRGI